jgi:hypothetical protein
LAIAIASLVIVITLLVMTPLAYLTTGGIRALIPGRNLVIAALMSFGAWAALDAALARLSVNGAQYDVVSLQAAGIGSWAEVVIIAVAHVLALAILRRRAARVAT